MLIQIIGAPGTGKTHAIKEYINKNKDWKIKHLDIAKYKQNNKTRYKLIKNDIFKYKKQNNLIIESACGFNVRNSIVIRYNKNINTIYSNYKKREKHLDENYMSLLISNSLVPDYTVNNKIALYSLLNHFLTKRAK
jgi:hypothetical protein